MKTRRFFQATSAVLALILSIVLLAVSLLTLLPVLTDTQIVGGFIGNLINQISVAVAEIDFLQFGSWYNEIIYNVVSYLLPALLLLIAAIVLFSKPKKSQGKYIFADILALLGLVIFTVLVEIAADTLFGADSLMWRLILGAYALILIVCIILSLALGHPKKEKKNKGKKGKKDSETAATEEQSVQQTNEVQPMLTQTEVQPTATPVQQQQPVYQQPAQQQPAYQPVQQPVYQQPVYQQPVQQPVQQQPTVAQQPQPTVAAQPVESRYVPEQMQTVSSVSESTYGRSSETISTDNFKKIETLRSLRDARAISDEEYTALVDAYLHEGSAK